MLLKFISKATRREGAARRFTRNVKSSPFDARVEHFVVKIRQVWARTAIVGVDSNVHADLGLLIIGVH